VNTKDLTVTLQTLCSELINGPPKSAYMLNAGDRGLLASLDKLSAAAASKMHAGGAPIAAHVEHLRYGLSLMNRWSEGEDPFADAHWAAAWTKTTVTDDEWRRLRGELRKEAEQWLAALGQAREVSPVELNGMVGSIAHLAYHLGAIRQIDRATRGPLATEST
jgi:hypothetical protein